MLHVVEGAGAPHGIVLELGGIGGIPYEVSQKTKRRNLRSPKIHESPFCRLALRRFIIREKA